MTSQVWIAATLALGMATVGSAQTTTPEDRAQKSFAIFEKNIKLDLYNQILPLLFTKEQFRAILPAIERTRQRVRETEKLEFDELQKLEAEMDKALKDAADKQALPPAELMTKISNTLKKLSVARRLIVDMNIQEVNDAFMKVANPGQQKAAANSLNLALYYPNAKPEEVKNEQKLRIFVSEVLLHPAAYDLMRKLSL